MTSRPRSSSSRWWFYFNLTDGNESGDYSRWYDVCIDICRRSPVLISTPQLLLMHPWPVTPGSRWVILTFRIDGDLDYYDRFDALQITLIFRPLQPLLPLPPAPVTLGSRWVIILTIRIDGNLDYENWFDALQVALIFRQVRLLMKLRRRLGRSDREITRKK